MNPETTITDHLEFTLEATLVARFHATPSVPSKQPVGLHCAGVFHILHGIIGEDFTRGGYDKLMVAAMTHDQDELMTGDIPFTFKRDFPAVKESIEDAAEAYADAFLCPVPELTRREKTLLKLADMLEGMWWTSIHEASGTVNRVWAEAVRTLVHRLEDEQITRDEVSRCRLFLERFTHPNNR